MQSGDLESMPVSRPAIDHTRQCYPNCILWSPLPPITWVFPFIGHTGIADSNGVLYDFAGPYHIGKGRMIFGNPTRYIQLDPALARQLNWDAAVSEGNEIYSHRMHNLFCDNCHSHVAKCLNLMTYAGKKTYNMVYLAAWFFFAGRFVSLAGFLKQFAPFCILCLLFLLFLA